MEDKQKAALEHFKDWSNYLLVTTAPALGWTAKDDVLQCAPDEKKWVILLLAAAIALGILTLALIPLVAEQLKSPTKSIYEMRPTFKLIWLWEKTTVGEAATLEKKWKKYISPNLKWFSWPQHLTFLIAIVIFAYGAAFSPCPSSATQQPNNTLHGDAPKARP